METEKNTHQLRFNFRLRSVSHKSEKDIHNEIQGIIRQITASVTFLPMLEDQCKVAMRGAHAPAILVFP